MKMLWEVALPMPHPCTVEEYSVCVALVTGYSQHCMQAKQVLRVKWVFRDPPPLPLIFSLEHRGCVAEGSLPTYFSLALLVPSLC